MDLRPFSTQGEAAYLAAQLSSAGYAVGALNARDDPEVAQLVARRHDRHVRITLVSTEEFSGASYRIRGTDLDALVTAP